MIVEGLQPAKRKILVAFITIILLCNLPSSSMAAGKTIKACGHHDYAPWNWKSDGKITGACAKITEELFKRVGVETDLTYVGPWRRCQALIEEGVVDLNICSFINEKRKSYSKFIMTPMGFNENAVFVKTGKQFPFKRWEDLAGKKTAMVRGVSIGQVFDDFLESKTELIWVSSYFQSFHMLARGRIDFVPVGRFSGLAIRDSLGLKEQIVDLPEPLLPGKLYISMSNKSPHLDLLPEIEKFIQSDDYYPWVQDLLEYYIGVYAEEYAKSHQDEQLFKSQ